MFKHAASSLWRRLTSRRRATEPPVGAEHVEDERRVGVRHPADLRTQVAPAGDEGGFPARIRDLSRGGLKLLADRPFDPGDLVTVGLPDANGAPNLTVLACGVHCQALGPQHGAVGCNLFPGLSEAELRAFG